jgi:hypothetical protein
MAIAAADRAEWSPMLSGSCLRALAPILCALWRSRLSAGCAAGEHKDDAFGGNCIDWTAGSSSWYAEDVADDYSCLGHWTYNGVVGASQGDGFFFLAVLLIAEGDADDVGKV